jgi:hypothetical protein
MRLAKIVVVLIVIAALITWVRAGTNFGHIVRCLPFLGGHKPGFYDVGALTLLGLAVWGISRLGRSRKGESAGREAETGDTTDFEATEDFNDTPPGNSESQDDQQTD